MYVDASDTTEAIFFPRISSQIIQSKMESERLQRHIRVFEDKIITAQHTFSPRTFHEMMKTLKSIVSISRIMSMKMLREIIEQEWENAKDIDEHPEDSMDRQIVVRKRRVRVYFKWYLDFVDYLRAMKHNFDSRIHKQLLRQLYANIDESPYGKPSTIDIITEDDHLREKHMPLLTDFSSLSSSSTTRTDIFIQKIFKNIAQEYRAITDIYENRDIDLIAERLLKLGRKLEHLLKEDRDLDSTLSKIPKPHDGKKDVGDDILNFIHLMNYTFVKFKSLIDLSKSWFDLDSTRMKTLQEKVRKLKEIQKMIARKKTDLDFAIKKHQLDIERESENLTHLLALEERVNDLSAKLFDTEQTIISLKEDLSKSRDERDVIAKDLLTIPSSDKDKFGELKKRYEKNRINRFVLYKTVQSMEYKKNLLQEDIEIETSLKASVIRCTNDIQERIEQLELLYEEESNQLKVLEQIHGPLQKDRQNIEGELLRQIMTTKDNRTATKNHVWGSKSPSMEWNGSLNRLSAPQSEFDRTGSGRLTLLDPKFSIREMDEDHSLRRTNTVYDIRSKHQVLRNIESDPVLHRHSTMDHYGNYGPQGGGNSVKDPWSGHTTPSLHSERSSINDGNSSGSAQTYRWY